MPQWKPKIEMLGEQIDEEIGKLQEWQARETLAPEIPTWQPAEALVEEPVYTQPTPVYTQPVKKPVPEVPKVEAPKADVGFWQRALQVFATPFQWIDDYVIKPALSIAGTTVGAIPDVEREPGEDFYDWKMRSWEAWETPGIDIGVPWSDGSVRLDFKGILAFAPWLFIPGAGQVGGATGIGARLAGVSAKAAKAAGLAMRPATGIAGKLGAKLGTFGRYAGTVVEYSPWGMVEKTAGLAMKATARAISRTTERVTTKVGERIFGKIPEPVVSPAVKRVTSYWKESIDPALKAFKKAKPLLRKKQEAVAARAYELARQNKISQTEAIKRANAALAKIGGIRAKFAVKAPQEVAGDIDELLGMMNKGVETGLVTHKTAGAFRNMLLGLDLPEPAQIKQFARVFGADFANTVKGITQKPLSFWEKVIDVLNIPRATLAMGDLSITARQQLILNITHPTKAPRWFWEQLKYFTSEKLTLQADDIMRADPLFAKVTRKLGLDISDIRKGAIARLKEEPFMSNFAENLPFMRRSERAFTGGLNLSRWSVGKQSYLTMTAQGAADDEIRLMMDFINKASGKGKLPFNLNRYAPALNTVLFSAKYQMSTLQLPRTFGRMLLSKNPYMRKEGAKALVTFVGGGVGILGLIAAGGGMVETDPRAGDFGKIKIGETRFDIWRGYIQYARFAAQILTGERKSAYGNLNKVSRGEIASRFLQSKASPALGLMVDLLKGENYMGETLFEGPRALPKAVKDRMLPLAIQDVIDAMEQGGAGMAWTAAPALLGVGTLTYVNDFVRTKERIARDLGYETWDAIDPLTQRKLQNTNTELQAAFIEFDRQVMGTAWGDWGASGRAVEDVFRENIDLATAQYRSTGDGYNFREKVADAFTARRGGYQARSADERFVDIVQRMETQDTVESLVSLGPEQLAIRTYTEAMYGEDMYDEFGDYRFDLAERRRIQLRQELGDLFNYVEQYRGLKFEDLPPEYQELARAKIVMRPYWQVRDEAIRILGEPKTKWAEQNLEQFISRTRKRLRLSNRDINYFYEKFYVRT